jgi:hypothetical protein
MPAVAYIIIATFTDPRVADEWMDWLKSGHIEQVLQHGANDAEIVRVDSPQHHIEVRYHFRSRQVFSDYEINHAPKLRAEGTAKFPPHRGISYERTIGIVEATYPAQREAGSTIQGL